MIVISYLRTESRHSGESRFCSSSKAGVMNGRGRNRAVTDLRCLGGVNRARKVVYSAISIFRHEKNHAPRVEPKSWEL